LPANIENAKIDTFDFKFYLKRGEKSMLIAKLEVAVLVMAPGTGYGVGLVADLLLY